jgi:peroxiredoxin Q/BCP
MLLPLSLLLAMTLAEGAARPGAGDVAPAFSLPASTGQTVSLADYQGKKAVVLAFFPKAFTGG